MYCVRCVENHRPNFLELRNNNTHILLQHQLHWSLTYANSIAAVHRNTITIRKHVVDSVVKLVCCCSAIPRNLAGDFQVTAPLQISIGTQSNSVSTWLLSQTVLFCFVLSKLLFFIRFIELFYSKSDFHLKMRCVHYYFLIKKEHSLFVDCG